MAYRWMDDAEENLVDEIVSGTDLGWSIGANLYIGLSTASPGDDGAGIAEPSGNGYARLAIPRTSAYWTINADGTIENKIDFNFPVATGAWGTLTDMFISEAASGGDYILYNSLTASVSPVAGQRVIIPAGDFTFYSQNYVTEYGNSKINDFIFSGGSHTLSTNLYVGLSTAEPLADESGLSEPSGNGYARVAVARTNAQWNPTATGGERVNVNDITFPTATGAWGTITYAFLADSSTGGHIYIYDAITSISVLTGNIVKILAGSFSTRVR